MYTSVISNIQLNHEHIKTILIYYITYHTAAAQHDQESTNSAGSSHHPGQTDEQDNAENVLNAWQEDSDQGTQKWITKSELLWYIR